MATVFPLILNGNKEERELENVTHQSVWTLEITHDKNQNDTEKKVHQKTWSILEQILQLTSQKKSWPSKLDGATQQIFETSCILSYNENFYFAMKKFILF